MNIPFVLNKQAWLIVGRKVNVRELGEWEGRINEIDLTSFYRCDENKVKLKSMLKTETNGVRIQFRSMLRHWRPGVK